MKYAHLVWFALRRKPMRTVLTSLSIITAFFLFGMLQAINVGIDTLVKGSKDNHLLIFSRVGMATPLPVAHVARVAALPGIADVTGVSMLVGTYQRPRNVMLVAGVDIQALFRIYAGQMMAPPEQLAAAAGMRSGAIVGRALAQRQGWKIGDRVPIRAVNMRKADGTAEWVFDIVGIYDRDQPDSAMWLVANYDYINEARGDGRNTVFQIAVGVQDAAQTAPLAQAIDDLFANSANQTLTQTERDFVESILSQLGDINFIVNGIVGAVLFTLLALTANTMAQSVRERIPELAVLKTVGFTDVTVQWLVLAEALLLCLFAAMIGLAAAAAVLPLVSSNPSLGMGAMRMPNTVFAAGTVAATLVALASGLPLARKARRLDIAAALAGR